MKNKITELALTIFFASILIYAAVILFMQIWWVLALLISIITIIVIGIRLYIWRFRNRW